MTIRLGIEVVIFKAVFTIFNSHFEIVASLLPTLDPAVIFFARHAWMHKDVGKTRGLIGITFNF